MGLNLAAVCEQRPEPTVCGGNSKAQSGPRASIQVDAVTGLEWINSHLKHHGCCSWCLECGWGGKKRENWMGIKLQKDKAS